MLLTELRSRRVYSFIPLIVVEIRSIWNFSIYFCSFRETLTSKKTLRHKHVNTTYRYQTKSWEFLFHLWNNEENIWKKSKREQNGEAEEIRNKGYCTMSKLLGPKIISYKPTWMSWLWEARESFYAPAKLAEKRKMKKRNEKRLDGSFRRVRVLVKLLEEVWTFGSNIFFSLRRLAARVSFDTLL